jgi:hypothetical protein
MLQCDVDKVCYFITPLRSFGAPVVCCHGLQRCLHCWMVLDWYILSHFEISLAKYSVGLVPADLTQPRKKQGFATKRAHLPYHDAHRALHDFFGEFRVVVDTCQSETKQARKILFEKDIECPLVTCRHAGGK